MDPLSHYIFAWLVARRLRLETSYYKAFLIFALLPDFDVSTIVFGNEFVWRFHGTLTHSLFVAPFLVLIAIVFLRMVFPMRFAEGYVYGLLAVGTHLFLDFFNLSQNLLWPLQHNCSLKNVLGLSWSQANTVYLSIFLVMASITVYLILRRDYPWSIWFKGA